MNTYTYALTVLLSIQVQCSMVPSLPSETVTAVVATTVGFTRRPTEAPVVVDLLERQAYFSTCAYYNGSPYTCAASGHVCATNIYNYAACCPMNNLAGCTIAVACVDYTAYAAYGSNPFLYLFNTGICTDPNLPYCTAKIWNYATPYTELGCGTQPAIYTLDPNPDIPSGPAAAPAQPDQSEQGSSGSDTSGQSISGNQNTQISGDNVTVYVGDGGGDGSGGNDGGGQSGGASQLSYVDILTVVTLIMLMRMVL